jgi:DNA-binding transcriptional MerR regulator
MNKKKNLLSIGDVSKLTGAGINSLRYYERINILKPAYVSEESGYRYYTSDQLLLVSMIKFCVELDIPLAKMTRFIEDDGALDFRSFIKEGREVAEKKLHAIKRGLHSISQVEHHINIAELYPFGEIYTREIPEMKFHTEFCASLPDDVDQLEILKSLSNLTYWNDDNWVEDDDIIGEYGFLSEHAGGETVYNFFVRVPKNSVSKKIKTIPGGKYLCIQSRQSEIKNAAKIFANHTNMDAFLAIETEILAAKHKVSEPIWELRTICND